MGSSQAPSPKYVVRARIEVDGVVEKPDVIGAIFGQTEGLFGPELDLRELQKTGRVGRIGIEVESKQNKTIGTVDIPSSLDRASTAIIAAALESVDRVGPCAARVTIDRIEDARETKRTEIVSRAKQILKDWTVESMPGTEEVVKEVFGSLKPADVVNYGPENLPAGPDVETASSIIIVEGRADVINLLKVGIKNVIAIEGANVPETVVRLSKDKEVTAFLDGDHGGDIILKELLQVVDIDYVARAPPGKEVEELTAKELLRILRGKIPVEQLRREAPRVRREKRVRAPVEAAKEAPHVPEQIAKTVEELKGTLEAVVFDKDLNPTARLPVGELYEKLQGMEGVDTIVFDGVITQRLVDISSTKSIRNIIADRVSDITKRPVSIKLLTFADFLPRKTEKPKEAP